MKTKVNLLLFVFLVAALSGWSQQKWSGNLFLGGSSYMGDLVHSSTPYLDQSNLAFGLGATYSIKPTFGVRFSFLHAGLKGDDAVRGDKSGNYPTRNVSFSSGANEIAAVLKWDIFGAKRYDENGVFHKIFTPYLFAGVGLEFVSLDADYSKTPADFSAQVAQDKLDAESGTSVSIPFGGGVALDLNENMTLGLELGLRNPFTDLLDGVSALGDADNKDWFSSFGLTLDYRFGDNDMDKDGIVDAEDACPEVFGAATAMGCPDADGDGIKDALDACPNTVGLAENKGCPDTDGDGVIDSKDDCPTVKGSLMGCPDSDKDGIADSKEGALGTDPNNPDTDGDGLSDGEENKNGNGTVDAGESNPLDICDPLMMGDKCDKDGDGVPNGMDACPDVAGLSANKGCPDTDTDGDGIVDRMDSCPKIAGTKANKGCPEIKAEVKETLDLAIKNVQFETSSAKLLSRSFPILDKIAQVMNDYPYYSLRIAGHTDNRGNDAFNQTLSENRAKTCYDYLVSKGINANRMSHAGYGETQPVATNDTKAGRLQNRRVMFELFVK